MRFSFKAPEVARDKPTLEHGLSEYKKAHNIDGDVTKEMLENSKEGLGFWCCKGFDMSARGSEAQAFKRAVKWDPEPQKCFRVSCFVSMCRLLCLLRVL